jgi:hypothetical protein
VPLPIRYVYTTRIIWGGVINLWGRLWEMNLEWTAVLMFLFAASSILLVSMIGRRVFGPAAALLAAAIQATYFINLRYDVMVTPDSLAVPLTLLSTLMLLDFLALGHLFRLVAAGALIGALIGIKDYYAMISIPFSICLLLRPPPLPPARQWLLKRIGEIAILGFAATATASLVLLLNYFQFGDALHQFHGFGAVLRDTGDSGSGGFASIVAVIGGRFKYFYYMLAEHGVVGGVMFLVGAVYLGSLAMKRLDCRLLFMIPMLFLIFLSLMFLSLRPLRFIAQEPRYIILLAPYLAIGAAGAIAAAWDRIRDDVVLRRCFAVLLAATAALNLWLPNYRNAVVPVATTLRNSVALSITSGASYLVLPWYFRWSAPDGPTLKGIEVRYTEPKPDYAERVDRAMYLGRFDYQLGQIDTAVADGGPAAIFVPEDMGSDTTVKALEARGFRKIDLLGSTSSLRNWMEFSGLAKGDTSCGWLYVRK